MFGASNMASLRSVALLLCLFVDFSLSISSKGKALLASVEPLLDEAIAKPYGRQDATSQSNPKVPENVEWFPSVNYTNVTAQYFPQYDSKRVKGRWGPFPVPPMTQTEGMIDYLQIGTQMPCTDCLLTHIQAGLEYPNGTYANANTSLWLHHVIFIQLGAPDTVCGSQYYGRGQRWWASGNERTPGALSLDGTKPLGYYVEPGSTHIFLAELMNQAVYPQDAVPTIEFEYIEGMPFGFTSLTPIWMDIAGCKIASDMPVKNGSIFQYTSPTYYSNITGAMISTAGHLHDGGTSLELWQDLKTEVCNSVAHYGEDAGYIDAPGMSMVIPQQPMFNQMQHISHMSYCLAPIGAANTKANGIIQVGTQLSIQANYNFTEHIPMFETDGSIDDIMGISIIYVAENWTSEVMASFFGSEFKALDEPPPYTGMYGLGMMSSMGGDDDDDDDDAAGGDDDDSAASSMAGMSMMSMGMSMCVPMRDSPGTITLQNLNMTDPSTLNTLLMAIMNDACLQVWSAPYARYFWYGIVVVIALFGFTNAFQRNSLIVRKSMTSELRSDLYSFPPLFRKPASKITSLVRSVSYRQYSPLGWARTFMFPSLGLALLVVAYFAFLVALQFINASTGDLQTLQFLSVRAAWLSVSQLPLIVLLATKKNLIGLVTGVGYERLNVLHRWTARGLLMTAAMHFGFEAKAWVNAGVWSYEMSDECVPTGAAALALVGWMNISTLPFFRRLSYEFFVLQHIITFVGTIVAIAYHVPTTAPYALVYVYVASALYLVTKLYQGLTVVWHNFRTPRASCVSVAPGVTRVTVRSRTRREWAPGAFMRLSIPRLGLIQSHPATVASTPTSNGGDIVFYLRQRSGFTKRLALPRSQAQASGMKAYLDGPYGGSQLDMASFPDVVLIAGSTGISFVLPIVLDLAHRASRVRVPLRNLFVVWSVRESQFAEVVRPELVSAIESLRIAGITASVEVHVTGLMEKSVSPAGGRSGSNSERSGSEEEIEKIEKIASTLRTYSDDSHTMMGGSGYSVRHGRPAIDVVLQKARDASSGDLAVAVCGPPSMAVEARNKVASMQFGAGDQGPVYLHVEGFHW